MTFRTLADRKDKGEEKKKERKLAGVWGGGGECGGGGGVNYSKLFLGKDAQVKPLTFQISSNNWHLEQRTAEASHWTVGCGMTCSLARRSP